MNQLIARSHSKGWGIGRTYRHLRRLKSNEFVGDYVIFSSVVRFFLEKNPKISRRKILYHFNTNVSEDDYAKDERKQIIDDLTKCVSG